MVGHRIDPVRHRSTGAGAVEGIGVAMKISNFNKLGIGGVLIVFGIWIGAKGYGLAGCGSAVLGLLLAFAGQLLHEHGPFPTRAEGHRDIRYLMDELTPEERRAEEQAERKNHNDHMASAAFWAESDDYVDYDGNTVKL